MSKLTSEEVNKIYESKCGVRENTPMGSFTIATNLSYREASDLIKKLEKEAEENGTYFEDRYVMTYVRP